MCRALINADLVKSGPSSGSISRFLVYDIELLAITVSMFLVLFLLERCLLSTEFWPFFAFTLHENGVYRNPARSPSIISSVIPVLTLLLFAFLTSLYFSGFRNKTIEATRARFPFTDLKGLGEFLENHPDYELAISSDAYIPILQKYPRIIPHAKVSTEEYQRDAICTKKAILLSTLLIGRPFYDQKCRVFRVFDTTSYVPHSRFARGCTITKIGPKFVAKRGVSTGVFHP